jgi:ATP-dependent DNA helicase RecG
MITLSRVGQVLAKKLKKLGLENNLDLLFYYPSRYEDFSQVSNISDLQPEQTTTVKGRIEIINNRRSWRRRMMITEAVIRDDTEAIKIIWFNQPFITKILKPGEEIFISGKVSQDQIGLFFKNPIYEKVKSETTHTARIIPIYPLTEGITEKQLRFLTKQVMQHLSSLGDWLPEKIIQKYKLLPLKEALQQIHFPDNWQRLRAAQRRLSFDELFTVQLLNLKNKKELASQSAPIMKFQEKAIKNLVNNLPFKLTTSQKKCAWQIIKDLQNKHPMNRLLEGDVGSGKTVIAAIAMYNAALNNYQAILMAPTEILAIQHYQTLTNILGKDTVAQATKNKKTVSHESKIIVGTHALIQGKITFNNIGLVIIDEQHRFGVKQRQALQNKSGLTPHFLSMTATPIPRTLALTVYGDLDLSIIDEMPKGRKKILTKVVAEEKREKAYQFVREKIAKGDQAFVICPLISESDKLGVKSVEAEYERLKKDIFPDLNIAKLHGKLKTKIKDEIMHDFKNKKYDLLVSTSVVEVGVDIPNATIMMIEGAERFGLAQLHQFRGRVGRSEKQSFCLLFANSSIKRLEALVKSHDGFKLAEYDLKLRGPGAVYGTEQSGFLSSFKIANLSDHILIAEAKEAAASIIDQLENYPLIQRRIEKFQKKVHFE